MEIESRAFHPRAFSLPENDPQMCFIRRFVRAETNIPVDSEKGAIDPGFGMDRRKNRLQPISHSLNEAACRIQDMNLIIGLVSIEPGLGVVTLERLKKLNRLLMKSVELRGFLCFSTHVIDILPDNGQRVHLNHS